MKTRLLWTLILAVGGVALYCGIVRPEVTSIPSDIRDALEDLKPPVLPPLEPPVVQLPDPPVFTLPALPSPRRLDPIPPRAEVPIQNQATIDFSTGAPVVRTHGKDQDALESALKEISEVLKDAKIDANPK
jgi:hypothetical protein